MTNETIGTAKRRVDPRTHTNQSSRDRELQVITLCMQRDDAGEDRLAPIAALCVLCDNARPDLDLLSEAEDTGEDGTASNTALELVDLGTGFVDVEGTDDDQAWVGGEVADRDGDTLHNVLIDSVNVVLELSRDRNDWRRLGDGT